MNEAYIIPEAGADRDWSEETDGVTSASIKILDDSKKRDITPKMDENIQYPFEDNYHNATWLLYRNFASAIKGKEKLELGLNDGYQSAISVHMANKALRTESIERWLPEYDI